MIAGTARGYWHRVDIDIVASRAIDGTACCYWHRVLLLASWLLASCAITAIACYCGHRTWLLVSRAIAGIVCGC